MRAADRGEKGFTLLELLLAVGILSAVMAITFLTFGIVTRAWRRGVALMEDVHHGDFVMEQLVMGLRSAYYPDAGLVADYGFWMEDRGDAAFSRDRMSWVKQGGALTGADPALAGGPHRVVFAVEDDAEGRPVATVKAWRLQGQPEDFDPAEDVPAVTLSPRITGFNCRPAFELDEEEGIDWLDEWEDTNRIPLYVEVTLYTEPAEEGGDPVAVRRAVSIPVAALCWAAELEDRRQERGTETQPEVTP